MIAMSDVDLRGKRVLIREDFNVPMKDGAITDDTRLRAGLPTLRAALEAGATVIVMSHLGRPVEGEWDASLSLAPVAEALSALLDLPVGFAKQWIDGIDAAPGSITLCENVRFLVGEKRNDHALSARMATLCDVFVNDAFATAHRAQASTEGVARAAPVAVAGPLLAAELLALDRALSNPRRPLVAIVGGAKVSTKLALLESLVDKVDQLIVGGGIANTFLSAAGRAVGASLCENEMTDIAARLIASDADIPIPTDVVCAKQFSASEPGVVKNVADVSADDMIMDLGPDSIKVISAAIENAGTVLWNGPLGVFEFSGFAAGTRQ